MVDDQLINASKIWVNPTRIRVLSSGVSQSTINNIVSGRNRSTTVTTVKKLCDGLGITLGEFFSTKEFDALEQELI